MRRWLDGDRDAGEALFRRHAPNIKRFFMQRTRRNVDDLIQRTFLTCMVVGRRYRGDGNVRAFLLGIARNELSAEWRRSKRRREALAQWEREVASRSYEIDGDPEETKDDDVLMTALRALPEPLRITLELLYWQHLTRAEIAGRLGVPQGTAASRIRLAHRHLRRALARKKFVRTRINAPLKS